MLHAQMGRDMDDLLMHFVEAIEVPPVLVDAVGRLKQCMQFRPGGFTQGEQKIAHTLLVLVAHPLDVNVNEPMKRMGRLLRPMAGQAHHFLQYAREDLPYAKERYRGECRRLYTVLEKRLSGRDFVAGEYSIADIAIVAWVFRHQRHEIDLAHYPQVRSWYERLLARSAVQRGFEAGRSLIEKGNFVSTEAQSNLFGVDAQE